MPHPIYGLGEAYFQSVLDVSIRAAFATVIGATSGAFVNGLYHFKMESTGTRKYFSSEVWWRMRAVN